MNHHPAQFKGVKFKNLSPLFVRGVNVSDQFSNKVYERRTVVWGASKDAKL